MATKQEVDEKPPSKLDLSHARGEQAKDIAERTKGAEMKEWHEGYKYKGPPLGGPKTPGPSDPHYAVEGLKGHVAEGMRQQGEEATLKAGKSPIPATKVYIHGFGGK